MPPGPARHGVYVDISVTDRQLACVCPFSNARSAESCIRKAVVERGIDAGRVGLADAKAEDEAASRWADCAVAYGD